MPPLPAGFIHARDCKLKCEKFLTRPPFAYFSVSGCVDINAQAERFARGTLFQGKNFFLLTYDTPK